MSIYFIYLPFVIYTIISMFYVFYNTNAYISLSLCSSADIMFHFILSMCLPVLHRHPHLIPSRSSLSHGLCTIYIKSHRLCLMCRCVSFDQIETGNFRFSSPAISAYFGCRELSSIFSYKSKFFKPLGFSIRMVFEVVKFYRRRVSKVSSTHRDCEGHIIAE